MRLNELPESDPIALLDLILDKYIKDAKTGLHGAMFAAHGQRGVRAAKKFKIAWHRVWITLQQGESDGTITMPLYRAHLELKRLMADKKRLKGNFRRHSLNTYLYVYSEYLSSLMKQKEKPANYGELYEAIIKKEYDSFENAIKSEYTKVCEPELKKEGYTPSQAARVVVHEMHRMFKFQSSLGNELGFNQLTNLGKIHYLADGYEFLRQEGDKDIKIRYFFPVKDCKGPGDSASVTEWLDKYKNSIKPEDMIILPVLQIEKDRKHFNTIVIYQNYIYDIEPRSRVAEVAYPTAQAAKTINKEFANKYKLRIIYMGDQSLLDDTECGAYHINYALQLASLPSGKFSSAKLLKPELEKMNHSSRYGDERILMLDRFYREQSLSLMEQSISNSKEMNDEILDSSTASLIKEEIDFVNVKKDKTAHHEAYSVNDFIKNENTIQSNIHMTLRKVKNQRQIQALNYAHNEINKYFDYYTVNAASRNSSIFQKFFRLFSKHTRANIAGLLKDTLYNKAQNKSINPEESIVPEMMLIHSCYVSIRDKESALRLHLERALVAMLDCSIEYADMSSNILTAMNIEKMLTNKLKQEMRLANVTEEQKTVYKNLKKKMRSINSLDTNIVNRFFNGKKEQDAVENVKNEFDQVFYPNRNSDQMYEEFYRM